MFQNVKEGCVKLFDFLPQNKKYIGAFFVITILAVVALLMTGMFHEWNDVYLYFEYSSNIFNGQMPYRDFVFEYPPFTIPFILIPRFFTTDLQIYCTLFSVMTLIFFLLGTVFLLKIAKHFGTTNVRILIFATVTLVMMNTLVFARNDIIPITICIIGVYLYLQKRYNLAWIVIAIGAMTKLFPILFLPMFLIPLIIRKDYRNAIRGIILALTVAVLISLPFIISDISTAFDYLVYHSERGIQIESIVSSMILMTNLFDPGLVHVVFDYGSYNLVGSIPEAMEPFMMPMLMAAVLVFLLWLLVALYRKRESIEHDNIRKIIVIGGVILFLIFLTFNKVFSAQFVIWVLLLTALTQIDLFDTEKRDRITKIVVIYAILSGITATSYSMLIELNGFLVVILFARNMLHIVFTGYLIYILAQTIDQLAPEDKQVGIRALAHGLKGKMFNSRQ